MKKKGKAAVLVLTLACATGALYQGSSAYMTDRKSVVNELGFAGEKGLDAVLREPSWDPEKGLLLVPGTEVKKDPQVTNTSQSAMDELVALKAEFVYTEDCSDGKKPGEVLDKEDMAKVNRVFSVDYNADDSKKGNWVRFEGQKSTDAVQCFYYRKVLKGDASGQGETTVPLFTCVKIDSSVGSRQAEAVRALGGVTIRITGHVVQQMDGEGQFGLNSPEEAYQAGLFKVLDQ